VAIKKYDILYPFNLLFVNRLRAHRFILLISILVKIYT